MRARSQRSGSRQGRSQRGSALVLALGALSVAALAALLIASHTRELVHTGGLSEAALVGRTSADGGVEHARWALARDATFPGGKRKIGAATVTVRVEPVPGRASERDVEVRTEHASRGQPYRTRLDVRVRLGEGLPVVIAWNEH